MGALDSFALLNDFCSFPLGEQLPSTDPAREPELDSSFPRKNAMADHEALRKARR
jgi:hypothetical protein